MKDDHRLLTKLLAKIPANLASFAAGIFLSTATNLYTNKIFDTSCGCSRRVLISAFLLLMGAFLLTILSWALQNIYEVAVRDVPMTISPQQRQKDKKDLIEAKGWRLSITLIAAVACIVAGLSVIGWKKLDHSSVAPLPVSSPPTVVPQHLPSPPPAAPPQVTRPGQR